MCYLIVTIENLYSTLLPVVYMHAQLLVLYVRPLWFICCTSLLNHGMHSREGIKTLKTPLSHGNPGKSFCR